jgi:hypothetical protein
LSQAWPHWSVVDVEALDRPELKLFERSLDLGPIADRDDDCLLRAQVMLRDTAHVGGGDTVNLAG